MSENENVSVDSEAPASADATPDEMNSFMESAFDEMEEDSGEVIADQRSPVESKEESVSEGEDTPSAIETDATIESEPVQVEQAVASPQSMSAKDLEAFQSLSPDAQKWVTDRERDLTADYTRKTMDLADQRKSYERLDQILEPRRQQLAMDGMDDSTAVGQLFALSDFANAQPVEFVKYLMSQRNIPLSALNEPSGQTQTVDPQLASMQKKIQGFENFFTQQQEQAQAQESHLIDGQISKFESENEHYSELEAEMIPIVRALRQSDPQLSASETLAKAYKMSVAVNDGVSAKVEAAKAAKAENDKVVMAKARAAKSKKAAASNVRSSGAMPFSKAGAENVEDFIGDLVDERMTA